MGKTSSAVKNRYNAKAYDQLPIRIPKGQKAAVQAAADKEGESLNGFANKALLARMGLEEWPGGQEEPPHRCPCPCCGSLSLDEPGAFDICEVCGWEDDNLQRDMPDYTGGANRMSLNEARAVFKEGRPVM